jgi:hypothetical protein
MSIVARVLQVGQRTAWTASAVAICSAVACSHESAPPGQLVVALETDMALPDQIDTIELIVTINGRTVLDNPMLVGTGDEVQPIPATLTLVAGPDPSLPATIRVVGWKNGVARTLRQVITTVPSDRVGTLRMPVQWLCDGTAQAMPDGNGGTTLGSSCGPDAACQAGRCVPTQVPSSTLPPYQPELVFGGATPPSAKGQTAGTCFDTLPCMISGTVETPDDQCTVEMPAGGAGVNVALRVANGGICDTTGTTCFVPLDGESSEGWTSQNGRVALPPAVCDKLRTGLVAGVVVSTACPTKTEGVPPCGPWSSVTEVADAAPPVVPDAASLPTPTLIGAAVPDGGTATACCPLMADSARLYTCLCVPGSPVQVVSIDPSSGATTPVATFSPQAIRSQYATVLAGGDVWWIDRSTSGDAGYTCPVLGTSTADGGTGSSLAVIGGDVYDSADLLADATNLYALADNVSGLPATAHPVQLIRVTRATGVVTPLDTGGARALLQFTQDANAVYAGVDVDAPLDAGVERISQIVSFPKTGDASTPAATTVVENTLTTSDPAHGGFIGLSDDGTTLFALYEAPPAADGTVDTQVLKIDPVHSHSSTVYDEVLDPTVARLRLLGAVAGAVVLARDVTVKSDAGAGLAESAVLIVPASGGPPRIAASFAHDTPVFELQTPAFSPDTFWVNASGRVFRLPRGALQ